MPDFLSTIQMNYQNPEGLGISSSMFDLPQYYLGNKPKTKGFSTNYIPTTSSIYKKIDYAKKYPGIGLSSTIQDNNTQNNDVLLDEEMKELDEFMKLGKKNITNQQKFNKYSTGLNSLITGIDLIKNITAKRGIPLTMAKVSTPKYVNPYSLEKNISDQSISNLVSGGLKVVKELGAPEMVPSILATQLEAQQKANAAIGTDVMTYQNNQALADANGATQQEVNRYTTDVANAEAIAKDNLMRSELSGALKTQLFNTIPNAYMTNEATAQNSLMQMQLVYDYLKKQNKSENLINAIMMGMNQAGLSDEYSYPEYS